MGIETAEVLDTLRDDIRRIESTLRSELRAVGSSLRSEMHELHGDAKRHMDIATESLRDDIRIIAEGVVALSEKVDTLQR